MRNATIARYRLNDDANRTDDHTLSPLRLEVCCFLRAPNINTIVANIHTHTLAKVAVLMYCIHAHDSALLNHVFFMYIYYLTYRHHNISERPRSLLDGIESKSERKPTQHSGGSQQAPYQYNATSSSCIFTTNSGGYTTHDDIVVGVQHSCIRIQQSYQRSGLAQCSRN